MRYLTLALLVACGAEEAPHHIVDAEPYTEAQVTQIIEYVALTVSPRFPTFKEDLDAYGYRITATLTPECQMSGCASPDVEGDELVGGSIEFSPGTGTCIGGTALAHELLHLVTYIYGLQPEHEEPGFWGLSNEQSFEYIAASRGVEDCR